MVKRPPRTDLEVKLAESIEIARAKRAHPTSALERFETAVDVFRPDPVVGRIPNNDRARKLGWRVIDGGGQTEPKDAA